jgi:hypothetical protein
MMFGASKRSVLRGDARRRDLERAAIRFWKDAAVARLLVEQVHGHAYPADDAFVAVVKNQPNASELRLIDRGPMLDDLVAHLHYYVLLPRMESWADALNSVLSEPLLGPGVTMNECATRHHGRWHVPDLNEGTKDPQA